MAEPALIPALPISKPQCSSLYWDTHPPLKTIYKASLIGEPSACAPPTPSITPSQVGPTLTCRGTPTLLATSRIKASETAFEA